MGHTCSKLKSVNTSPSTLVDHGTLNPRGIYTMNTDYDISIVRNLIRKGQLAPFYEGSNEPRVNTEISYETECPICFLFYPSNMNRTRCCDKLICTECFLQLRRSSSSPLVPAVCPFCVQPNLGVLYIPPVWSKHYVTFKRRRSDLFRTEKIDTRRTWKLEPTDPDVVLVDTVRPKWEDMLEERRSSSVGTTRRRRVLLNNGERSSRRRPRRRSYMDDSGGELTRFTTSDSSHTIYDTYADMDLEDILVMEAIRLSLVTANQHSDAVDNHSNSPSNDSSSRSSSRVDQTIPATTVASND